MEKINSTQVSPGWGTARLSTLAFMKVPKDQLEKSGILEDLIGSAFIGGKENYSFRNYGNLKKSETVEKARNLFEEVFESKRMSYYRNRKDWKGMSFQSSESIANAVQKGNTTTLYSFMAQNPKETLVILNENHFLVDAVRSGDFRMVQVLISLGVDVNLTASDYSEPPIFDAARQGNVEMFNALAQAGAKADQKYLGDQTPREILNLKLKP